MTTATVKVVVIKKNCRSWSNDDTVDRDDDAMSEKVDDKCVQRPPPCTITLNGEGGRRKVEKGEKGE